MEQHLKITTNYKQINILIIIWILLFCSNFYAQNQSHKKDTVSFNWSIATKLPNNQNYPSKGLAGSFSGINNNALLIAGGANFPKALPWEGGKKMWSDAIFAVIKDDDDYQWYTSKKNLPTSMAYGISLAIPEGLLCIGGNNENGLVTNIVLISWNFENKKVTTKTLGNLPEGFLVTAGGIYNNNVYLTGIQNNENKFIKLPLSKLISGSKEAVWKSLKPCPGVNRQMPAYAIQNNGTSNCLYLFGGRSSSSNTMELLNDGYYFDFEKEIWHHLKKFPQVMAAPSLAYGSNSILIFGGDEGERLLDRSSLEQKIRTAPSVKEKDSLQQLLTNEYTNHSGFSKNIWSFNTITNTIQIASYMPEIAPVTTNAMLWDANIIIPMGEIRPGIRTKDILQGSIKTTQGSFGWLNYTVLACYFVILLAIGIYFSSRQKSTNDYFTGGGRIPWWAAGLSVFGTALSAITFMAIPAKTFATDWSYFFYNLSVLLSTIVVVLLFIPVFRKLKITTAYEYLEQRFNLTVRLFGSASFMLFQIGRIAIVLYLPAIALSLVTGIDISVCILVVGAFSIIYTLIGGIEAVIWTDVVQVIVLMGGAILSLVVIISSLGSDFKPLFNEALKTHKLTLTYLDFSWQKPTIWVVIIGGFFSNLITYSSDQTLVQRYLTSKDESGARKIAWTNALLIIPSTLIFFSVGTALFLYYSKFSNALDPVATNNDAIFPWFIINELPAGISGLLIAGLFSAAMSSLSSSINSSGTVFTVDVYKRFLPNKNEKRYLKVARISTLISGVLGVLFALWMATFHVSSLWDQFFKILGLFTGGLGGLFVLGVCFKRANGNGAIAGLLVSSVIQYWVSRHTNLHIFLYGGIGLLSCVIVGYFVSLLFKNKTVSL